MPFALAFMVSVVMHAAAIVMPGWVLPGEAAEPQPLEARLAPPPRPAPVAKRPKPQRAKHVIPAAVAAEPAAPVQPTPPESSSAAVPEPVAAMPPELAAPSAARAPEPAPEPVPEPAPEPEAAAPPAPPPTAPWPAVGQLRYVVKYGDGGFIIGETHQEWRIEGNRYSILSVAEPKGLAALRGSKRIQASSGEVTAAGLRPLDFRDQREGRDAEVASFDWTGAQVSFSGGRPSQPLTAGTQDMTSVFYQLAWLAPRQTVELAVATASRVGRWTFEWVGEEILELPNGNVTTLHLRTRAEGDSTDVWLAPAYGGLPIRIRYVDRKGDAFEQTADIPISN